MVPNPGFQQMALDSEADELFFGGELGPGKTSLLIGAALTQHEQSIIASRQGSHRERQQFCTMDDRVSARSWSRDRR